MHVVVGIAARADRTNQLSIAPAAQPCMAISRSKATRNYQ